MNQPGMESARLRVVMFAPHFVEYALRTAIGIARHTDVMAIVDEHLFRREVTPVLGLTHPNLRVVPVDFGNRGAQRFDMAAMVAEIVRFDPDVVHHQEQLPQMSMALMLRLRTRALHVLMVHDPVPHSSAVYQPPPQTWSMILRLRRAADLILVHGEATRAQLFAADPGLAAPVVLTRHGIILAPSPELRRPPEARRVLMFGWMQDYKGLDVLLEAVTILTRRNVGLRLNIAGRGPEYARLAGQLAALPDAIVEDIFLPPDDAIDRFQKAALVALPYRNATQSGVLASAFASGRPVIATRTGDMPSVVTHGFNGLLVEPGDASGLADALQRALDTPGLLATMAAGAAQTASTLMDWDRIGDDLVADYRDGIARKAAGAGA